MLDWIVVIMRAEPLHLMHEALIKLAAEKAENVLVLLGSANRARSPKNPWNWMERGRMIFNSLPEIATRITVEPLDDYRYNDQKWCQGVQTIIDSTCYSQTDEPAKIGLLTFVKDKSGYYQRMFPQLVTVDVAEEMQARYPEYCGKLNATDIRKEYFSTPVGMDNEFIKARVPAAVYEYMKEWSKTPFFTRVEKDFTYVESYKAKTRVGPYAPFFVCVDAMVVKNGHVLLIRRGRGLGEGNWALPGGHVEEDEKIKNALYRELLEETQLDLNGVQPRATKVFDDPERSAKGRVISHAYLLQLPYTGEFPKVIGSDDAAWAGWVPIADLFDPNKDYKGNFFDDHEDMIHYFLGLV